MKYLLLAVIAASLLATPITLLPFKAFPTHQFKHVKLLDAKRLQLPKGVNELSALIYEAPTLYALSDEGRLFHFTLNVKNKQIASLQLLHSYPLTHHNKVLNRADSEGLAKKDNTILLMAFEGNPHVAAFNLHGEEQYTLTLPKPLQNKHYYHGKNKMLESLAYHPTLGMITAPELPLTTTTQTEHTLYAQHHTWQIPKHGALTGLCLMHDDELLILERHFQRFSARHIITLSRLNLITKRYTVLLQMDDKSGWHVDNFEGITPVSDTQFIIISDDNDSPFQQTLLFLFELLD